MAQISLGIYTDGTGTEYTKYPCARVSKVKDDAHLYDLLDTEKDIMQGANLVAGDHVNGDLQTRVAKTPAKGDSIVFACDVPLIYKDATTLDQAEWQFYNKKGKITKCYEVSKDDVLGVSDYAITPAVSGTLPVIGNLIVTDENRGWKELAAATNVADYGFVAKIIGYEKYQFDTIVLFEVQKNTTVVSA